MVKLVGVLGKNWRPIFAIVYPFALLGIPIYWFGTDDPEKKIHKEPYGCYVLLLMSGYYMTECFPLAITSLIPMLLFPIFGIVSSDEIATFYLSELIVFLFGGCVIALAFEYSNFHLRIALKVISLIGAKSSQILLGIIVTSAALSMWMSNTSSTALMVPIVIAITNELREKMIKRLSEEKIDPEENDPEDSSEKKTEIEAENEEKKENEREEKGETKEVKNNSEKKKEDEKIQDGQSTATEVVKKEVNHEIAPEKLREVEKNVQNLRVMFLLAAAYGSNIGGTGLVTGSGTNLIAIDQLSKAAQSPVGFKHQEKCLDMLNQGDFIHWMIFNLFAMILNLVFLWVYLIMHFKGIPSKFRFWKKNLNEVSTDDSGVEKSVRESIKAKYKALGPLTFHEILVCGLFVVTIVIWVMREPKVIPGWGDIFNYDTIGKNGKKVKFTIGDASSTCLIVVLMTIVPRKKKAYTEFFNGGFGEGLRSPVLTWEYIQKKIPWGLIILLGGGSAMAKGLSVSGLNTWIIVALNESPMMQQLSPPILLAVVMLFCAILTTVSSNTATAAIVVPVLIELSFVRGIHPLYMALTVTTVCSYAFILPVSTPPNALVYDTGLIKQKDMVVPGLVITTVCGAFLYLTTNTLSAIIFGFFDYSSESGTDHCTKIHQ